MPTGGVEIDETNIDNWFKAGVCAVGMGSKLVSKKILDKVGSGDCFMAGLIYGFYQNNNPLDTLNFATAAAYNKLYLPSDATTATVADVEKTLAEND